MAKTGRTESFVIELDSDVARILRANASRQVRTPENLAKFLVLSGLGFVDTRLYNPFSEAEVQAAVEKRLSKRAQEFAAA